jgi:multidrug efflux pump subunit AcrA (membrane-fusion protein)
VVFDALPGERFEAKVSRFAAAEDPQSRSMRVEIDLDNKAEKIRDGMYGQVEIELEPSAPGITIPSSCLVGSANTSGAKVFVVADGVARLTSIQIGKDTGTNVEVVAGLTTHDRVIVTPPSALGDGMAVEAVTPSAKSAGH